MFQNSTRDPLEESFFLEDSTVEQVDVRDGDGVGPPTSFSSADEENEFSNVTQDGEEGASNETSSEVLLPLPSPSPPPPPLPPQNDRIARSPRHYYSESLAGLNHPGRAQQSPPSMGERQQQQQQRVSAYLTVPVYGRLMTERMLPASRRRTTKLECERISCVFAGDRTATVCFRAVRPAIEEPGLNELPGRKKGESKGGFSLCVRCPCSINLLLTRAKPLLMLIRISVTVSFFFVQDYQVMHTCDVAQGFFFMQGSIFFFSFAFHYLRSQNPIVNRRTQPRIFFACKKCVEVGLFLTDFFANACFCLAVDVGWKIMRLGEASISHGLKSDFGEGRGINYSRRRKPESASSAELFDKVTKCF